MSEFGLFVLDFSLVFNFVKFLTVPAALLLVHARTDAVGRLVNIELKDIILRLQGFESHFFAVAARSSLRILLRHGNLVGAARLGGTYAH